MVVTRRHGRWLELCIAAAVVPITTCDRSDPSATDPSEDVERVSYAGCAEVWLEPRPRCVFEPGAPIRLWIDLPPHTEITVRVDGEPRPTEVYTVDGMSGFGVKITLPAGAEELVVERPESRLSWSLPVRERSKGTVAPATVPTNADVDAALGLAHDAARQGRHATALWLLTTVEPLAERYPKGKADLATYRGLVQWMQGRHYDAAMSLREGVSFAMRMHDRELIRDSIHVYAGVLAELGYSDAAVEWADEVLELVDAGTEEAFCGEDARILSTLGYVHLLRARERGEPTTRARDLLKEALELIGPGVECSEPSAVPAIQLSLANEALDRGQPLEALETLRAIDLEATSSADERMRIRDAEFRALELADRPTEELEQALAGLEQEAAFAKLAEGRWRVALRRGDLRDREGRIEEAIDAYTEAEQEALAIAKLAALGVGREHAVTLHGESTERLVRLLAEQKRTEDALCVERQAQARRIQGVGVPSLTKDRRAQLDQAIERHRTAQSRLDASKAGFDELARDDREALRLAVARTEEQLAKAANDILLERSTWRPSCEDLVPRSDGELLLGLYPASDGWFVFVQDGTDTRMRWLEGGPRHRLDDPELGAELLDPLTEELAAARRIRVLASGRAQLVDVHLLSWRGAPLIEHVPVTYGAELPRLDPRATPEHPRALLVADPTEGLQMARDEVRAVASGMVERGWETDEPSPERADRTYVSGALEGASFFYFAGHGVHAVGASRDRPLPPYAGGSEAWPAHLLLASESRLEIPSILMLTSGPRHVALMGCETGLPDGSGGGMSLALAFLVAGAEQVVATPREVDDVVAADVGKGLLRGIHGNRVDLAAGLRSAQREALRRGKPVGRYRVWVR